MFTSFLDAALPDPVIEESSILPIVIIVAVVRYEIKRSREKKQGQNAQNNTDSNTNKTDSPGNTGSKTDR